MTYREFIDSAVVRLAPLYGADEARAAASSLLCRILDLKPYKVIAEPGTPIGSGAEALEEALGQLAEGRPLQYVLGFVEFCGLRIRVREGVLIPRPETEEMVSMIVDDLVSRGGPFDENALFHHERPIYNILDMCTGSGCIAYALADAFPEAQVFGCDVSDDALAVACRQRVKLQGARPVFFKADILQAPPAGLPKFDLIVSNPPYVRESERAQMRRNVLDYEPAEALFVPDDDPLRFYRAIRAWADSLLAPDGRIWLEINESLGPETAAVFSGPADAPAAGPGSGSAAEVIRDLSGKPRFVRVH